MRQLCGLTASRVALAAVFALGLVASSNPASADLDVGAGLRDKSGDLPADDPRASKDVIVTPMPLPKSRYPEIVDQKYIANLSQWGVEITSSPSAFGGSTFDGGPSKTWGLGATLEYTPESLQGKYGSVSFGPQMGSYFFINGTGNAPATFAVWSAGALVRYKMVFKPHQLIVPMLGYSYERVSFHLADLGDDSLSVAGAIYGLDILLSEVDTENSNNLYILSGITRVYLVAEGKTLEGSDAVTSLSGTSGYIGLRVEF